MWTDLLINYMQSTSHDLSFPVECTDVYIVERLFSSSLVVVVSLSMPRRMNVYHFKKGTEICNYSYSNNILSVRLNRQVRKRNWSRPGTLRVASSALCCCDVLLTPAAAGGVSGGIHLHPQYQGHETTQDPAQYTHQPHRYIQAVLPLIDSLDQNYFNDAIITLLNLLDKGTGFLHKVQVKGSARSVTSFFIF